MAEPLPPNGLPADTRIFAAIIGLCDAFAVCGVRPPVSIMVAPGQARLIEAIVRRSAHMLVEDARSDKLKIWHVEITEAVANG